MKYYLHRIQILTIIILTAFSVKLQAQTCEWRLVNPVYSSVDPDGAGPATGSVTFTMQIHTTGGTVNNVNAMSTGWSYQSASTMIPTTPGCAVVSNPANVTMSADFLAGGFAYTTVNQCGVFNQTTGGQTFDRRAVGTIDGTSIDITTTWIDVYTVTLWTLGTTNPEGGYVVINSGAGGSPGEFTTYAVSDELANEYVANSLTYTTPLVLGSGALPVLFTKFEANCTNIGAVVSWSTSSESNSSYFQLERSENGNDWTPVAKIKASATTSGEHNYQQPDAFGGRAYYRIKQVDLDGQYIYTNIIRTNCDSKRNNIVIYPVPARNILNVVISSDKPIKTQLTVIDNVGKVVRKINANLLTGNNTFQFDVKGLSSGEYIIHSNNPGIELNKKFNIVR
jgi:hypothetical protein